MILQLSANQQLTLLTKVSERGSRAARCLEERMSGLRATNESSERQMAGREPLAVSARILLR